ncbi:hypothetical protein [Pontibacter pamirensis]|uniref:hypothetical protein n=1 Tax=Pontibacter pamirensis TaxID=2562824 RepID=UPI0013898B9C|nr:hypothetical protein [Pontibacter pamirensis]
MNKLLLLPLLFILFLSSCKKDEPVLSTTMNLEVMKQKKSSTGEITVEPTSAIIHVWSAENREFDVNASPDIHFGSIYDKTTKSFQTMRYGAIGIRMREHIQPGRYFANVLLPKSSNKGSLAYSYTYFEIKKGENLDLTKIFSHDVESGVYEDWDLNK